MRERAVNFFFALSLFLLFAVVAVGCVVMGANIYRHTAATMDENYDVRTSVFYIQEKIRQNSGGVTVGEDGKSLVLKDSYKGTDYETRIFLGGQKLREVTVAAGTTVDPGEGQSIMDLADLNFKVEDNLLTIEVQTLAGESFSAAMALGGEKT